MSTAPATDVKLCPTCGASYPADYAVCPRDATPLAREGGTGDPLVGTVVGDTYEVVKRLGEGGMGRVYEVKHVRLGRRFALKVLHGMFSTDRESLARFRREATAAAAITSPHVAQVVDVNATRDGQPYLVTELCDGEDLGKLLEREGALPVGRAVRIARQVARGLEAAHRAFVVHRDLKPDNVMLTHAADEDGEVEIVKVLDFGIAKTADTNLTRTGTVLGTPAYMAPEQARGGTAIDHRVDVYALGAVLYRALTGRDAFAGEDAGRTLTSVLHDEPERPRTLRKDLPDALELVIQRAMAKDPDARFASMRELDAALAPFETLNTPAPQTTVRLPPQDLGAADTMIAHAAAASGPGATVASRAAATTASTRAPENPARHARPRALVWGAVTLTWSLVLGGSLLGAALAAVAARPLGAVERGLIIALALALSAPLAVAEVRRLVRGAWRNTATMLSRAELYRRTSLLSLSAYAGVEAPTRLWLLLTRRAPSPLAELPAILLALAVATVVVWPRGRDR